MNRIRHNFKVKGKNVKGWKEQAATIDPSTKIENKNEKQQEIDTQKEQDEQIRETGQLTLDQN